MSGTALSAYNIHNTHLSIWNEFWCFLSDYCSSFSTSCSQSSPHAFIFLPPQLLLFRFFCPSLLPMFITLFFLHPTFLVPPSHLLPHLQLCGFFFILFAFTRLTCSNALMLLIFGCQSSHPTDKKTRVQLAVFQLMAHISDNYTHTHTQLHTPTQNITSHNIESISQWNGVG